MSREEDRIHEQRVIDIYPRSINYIKIAFQKMFQELNVLVKSLSFSLSINDIKKIYCFAFKDSIRAYLEIYLALTAVTRYDRSPDRPFHNLIRRSVKLCNSGTSYDGF